MDDAAYEEFLRQIAYPQQQQNIRNAALGMLPLEQTTTATTRQSKSIWNNFLDGLDTLSKFVAIRLTEIAILNVPIVEALDRAAYRRAPLSRARCEASH
jgi:hypothetical protein